MQRDLYLRVILGGVYGFMAEQILSALAAFTENRYLCTFMLRLFQTLSPFALVRWSLLLAGLVFLTAVCTRKRPTPNLLIEMLMVGEQVAAAVLGLFLGAILLYYSRSTSGLFNFATTIVQHAQ